MSLPFQVVFVKTANQIDVLVEYDDRASVSNQTEGDKDDVLNDTLVEDGDPLEDDDLARAVCDMVQDQSMYDELELMDLQIDWTRDMGMELCGSGMMRTVIQPWWGTLVWRWR